MKKLSLLFLFCASAFGQAVRVDIPVLLTGPNVPTQGRAAPQALLATNATVTVCQHPSTVNSCTPVTTYTDSTEATACPTSAQLVALPGTSCTNNTGLTGKLGFWYAGGTVDYTVIFNGTTYGPYTVSGGSGGGGTPNLSFAGTNSSGLPSAAPYTPVNKAGDTMSGNLGMGANSVTSNTDVFPHPPLNIAAYGAKCDGTTDDTTAIQNAINAACNDVHRPPVYVPPSAAGCLFTKSLDVTYSTANHLACEQVKIEGDWALNSGSQLIANFPSGQAYPAIDFLGCKACGLDKIWLNVPSGSYATAGVLDGLYGTTGDGSDLLIRDSNIGMSNGNGSAPDPAVVIAYTDENRIEGSNLQGGGVGAIIGNGLGRASSITSEYGTIGSTINAMTQFTSHNSTYGGQQGLPALQLTGITDTYTFSGKTYLALTNASTNTGGILELTLGSNLNAIHAENFRTENQGTATGVCEINDDGATYGTIQGWFGTFTLHGGTGAYSLCSSNSSFYFLNSTVRLNTTDPMQWAGSFTEDTIDVTQAPTSASTVGALTGSTFRVNTNNTIASLQAYFAQFRGQSLICNVSGCTSSDYLSNGNIGTYGRFNLVPAGLGGQNSYIAATTPTATRTMTLPDANSNPVQPLSAATAGDVVQWIDSSGVQHLTQLNLSFVTVDPSGSCTVGVPMQYNTSDGKLWGCTGGTWTQITGSGSSLPAGVLGQTLVNTGAPGGATYAASSATMGVANGGAAITTAYTLLCDSATVGTGIQDRGKWAIVGASGSVTIPDLAGSGCSGFYGGILNSTGSSVTVSRQTSDTFNVYGPTQGAPSTGQTSFTVPAGGWASFEPSTSATAYDVRVSPPASGGGGSGTVTASPQYQVPVYSAAGTASTVTGDSNFTDNTSTGLLEYAGLLGFEQIASGAFSNTASNFYTQSLVNGCNPATQFYNVQFQYLSAALVGCITGPSTSPGSSYNQSAGVLGIAVGGAGANRPVGGSFYGFPEANSTLGYAINGVVQDVSGLTSGVLMAVQENDLQVENAASAYAGGSAYSAQLYNPGGHPGQFPFNAFEIQAHNSATWKYGLNVAPGALNNSGILFNVNANGTAVSGTNYNSPIIWDIYDTWYDGTTAYSQGFQLQALVGTGTSPNDTLFHSHPAGTAPAGSVHYEAWDQSTNTIPAIYTNSTTLAGIIPYVSGAVTAGDCVKFGTSGNYDYIQDTGSACGSGGTAFQVNGTGLTSSSTVNFQNSAATDGLTLTFANPSAGNVQLGLSGTLGAAGGGTGISTSSSTGIAQVSSGTWSVSTALANGTTATTQTSTDNTTDVATDAFVQSVAGSGTHTWSCQPGLGDGLNAIPAGTYLQTTCMNTTGSTVTLTGLSCYVDGGTASTMNASGHTLGALLTSAVTCSTSFAAGTQSANVALTNGDYITFTFVADGTAKQTTWVVKGTY